jgi:prevent-host-death family protein
MMYTSCIVTTEVPAKELRQHLAEYLDETLTGERFVITRNGRPAAQLGPVDGRSVTVEVEDR